MIKQLGIKFGDNDFQSTFEAVLEAYAPIFNGEYDLIDKRVETKESIACSINLLSFPMYLVGQNRIHEGPPDENSVVKNENVRKWLQIKPDQVYINDEVTELLSKDDGWYNSEFFFIRETGHETGKYQFMSV